MSEQQEPYSLQDTIMQIRFKEIVRDYGIKVIVETGIDKGHSTVFFSSIVDRVIAIDNNLHCFVDAYKNLVKANSRENVIFVGDSSPIALRKLQPFLPRETLYFLDAHWQDYWPLRDEVLAIKPGTGVIVMHDILVPGHPELGYDSYGGQPLRYEYVKDVLTSWSPKHRVEYNFQANCPLPRGVAYIFPE